MFEKYTFKKKFQALLLVFVMLSVAAYKRSFRSCLEVYSAYRSEAEKAASANDNRVQVASISADLALMDQLIGKNSDEKERIQQEIVRFITQSGRAGIFDLQPIHQFTDAKYRIYTFQVDVTGNYEDLLRLAYDFEKQFVFSKLVGTNFYTLKKNNNQEVLHLKMTFQNYENIN